MAVRVPLVRRWKTFDDALTVLREQHAEIDSVIADFCESLPLGYLEATPDRVSEDPAIYAHKVDYPPFAA